MVKKPLTSTPRTEKRQKKTAPVIAERRRSGSGTGCMGQEDTENAPERAGDGRRPDKTSFGANAKPTEHCSRAFA
jgi:hypothetical protein